MNTVQENELWSKACSEPEHDSFCLFFSLMESGYGEVNDARN